MKSLGIIPARYASTRFPGKPLALIGGKPMIQRVYEQCLKSNLSTVVVATDDLRIFEAVEQFGGKAIMTSEMHTSGTDRCGEAANLLNANDQDIIVNIQGDEPFIQPELINVLLLRFNDPAVNIATLASKLSPEKAKDPNAVKVVFSKNGKAIYFSRFAIPFSRDGEGSPANYFKHIGIYAYRQRILQQIIKLEESFLEKNERLEQLRWIENEQDIYLSLCEYDTISIDTPEDLLNANHWIQHNQK
ncbi:3-deoxy-manno-octulosonate cytidylyltransferase [Bacteroidales bacterium OttesenSCG-928-B11]|nr:3-deoxy-manno-octulosonate cytidylyltransferase [Bacteroidales bacterium OttesenSCG-928-C03]MDL2311876.1 3-deoxy-manno-octulosonate cytidylyltransferase [Bacteroidales bacterium OttesenSCG-928-B11]MDL2326167.1 3-deoxy-manno-octulosonate cytidylyltransferase [Bacteroidales bacterium OttesenSCG-928-A14]